MDARDIPWRAVPEQPAPGTLGVVGEWAHITELEVSSGRLWLGDMSFVPDAETFPYFEVDPGTYQVWVQPISYGGERYPSAVRVAQVGSHPTRGSRIAETWTDTAYTGVCDYDEWRHVADRDGEAFGLAFDDIWSKVSDCVDVVYYRDEVPMAIVMSGMGDGKFAVYELAEAGRRVGVEVEFIAADEPYPELPNRLDVIEFLRLAGELPESDEDDGRRGDRS